ncbi:hypothetical protein P7C70_g8134, partial [Phenoliferia sp. Uapishka_3]
MNDANPEHPDDPVHEPKAGIQLPGNPTYPAPAPSKPSKTQSPAVNRPPGPPDSPICGPYLQFITTDNETKTWFGSALVLHRKDLPTPSLTFDHEVVHQDEADILYKDIFGYVATRHQLSFSIPDGMGDEMIGWTLETQGVAKDQGSWAIPKWDQAWRGGFFSCNGFDETITEGVVQDFGFDNVWKHLNSVHAETPLHLTIWGGDQIYIDFIFKDVPFLAAWIKMEWDVKWAHEFSYETSEYCASYSFFTYLETWERPEVKSALCSAPALMMWDDHDIFDGAGSYPDLLHDSPVMSGLFQTAQTMRLLFQHHTNPRLSNTKHKLFGHQGQNHIAQLGPRLAVVVPDGRTERNETQVTHPKSWDMIFDRMDGPAVAKTTQHLIVVFAVPFSFIRVPAAEAIFEFLKNRAPWVRKLPLIKSTNSIFGLPELYDDLLDEWTHEKHIKERDSALKRFQEFAANRSIRVTFLSGDVHCASMSRFRTGKAERKRLNLIPANDPKLMYQVIASAIVNQGPTVNACIAYHYVANSWKPIADTEEALVTMFERRPEGGKQVRHRKFAPNRNWCYFELLGGNGGSGGQGQDGTAYVVKDENQAKVEEKQWFHGPKRDEGVLHFARSYYAFDTKNGYPTTLGPTSAPNGLGSGGKPQHKHHHGPFCHHKKSKVFHKEILDVETKIHEKDHPEVEDSTGLKIRIWLESRKKEAAGRQFSSYELIIPGLVVGLDAKKK